MPNQTGRPVLMVGWVFAGQYGPLLTALLALCVFAPGLTGDVLGGALLDAAMSCIVLTGIYAADPSRRSILIGLGFGFLILATHRLVELRHIEGLHAVHYLLELAILGYAALTILGAILRDYRVTVETIKGAICVYLLIGLIWVYVFVLVDMLLPGSFQMPDVEIEAAEGHLVVRKHLPTLLYLSFTTMTTLGYGDVIPLRSVAKTACYMEAVVGQMYLTILVARLVGMHIARPPAGGS